MGYDFGLDDQQAMMQLLERLLVGARKPVDSVDAWSARLLDDPPSAVATEFVTALRAEWLPADPPDGLCQTIQEQVRHHLGLWHPGWPHLWAHTLRVTGAALVLAKETAVDPTVAYLTGVLHDVAKLDELRASEAHEVLGADFAARALRGHLPLADVEAIQAAILKEGDGPLAVMLHDADKLDKIGATGVMRRISVETRPSWLVSALWRVQDDLERFPTMHFTTSRQLAAQKRAFLRRFLTLADAATSGGW